MQKVRTNNDVEGWHHRINNKAGHGQLQFYLLVDLLHDESKYVQVQKTLVRNDLLSRIQRKEYQRINEQIAKIWDNFNNEDLTSYKLLVACSKIYGPVEDDQPSQDHEDFLLE